MDQLWQVKLKSVSNVFQSAGKPCVSTLKQLEKCAAKRNLLVTGMTKSSGSQTRDEALLAENIDDLSKGWADRPWDLSELPYGSTISRRFALQQGEKIGMIDDYTVSGK